MWRVPATLRMGKSSGPGAVDDACDVWGCHAVLGLGGDVDRDAAGGASGVC